MRWGIGNRWPAGDFRDCLFGQGKYPGPARVLVAGDQDRFGLLLQGGNGDLLQAPAAGGLDGGVQAAQIHVGGDNQGPPLIDGVPGGHIQGRRLVFLLQCGPGQPDAVVGLRHDLKLHRPSVVAGKEMNRKLEALVCASIRDQLGVGLDISLQLGEDISVALTSKDKSPLCPRKSGGLIGEGGQLIRESQLANARADVVNCAEQIPQVGDGRHTSATPGIGTTPPCDSRKEQCRRIIQFFWCRHKNIGRPSVSGKSQIRQSQSPLNSVLMVRFC